MSTPAVVSVDLNLRYGPNIYEPVIVTIPGGSLVDAGDCYDGWCEANWGDYEGYLSEDYLDYAAYYPGYAPPPPSIVVVPRYYNPYARNHRRHVNRNDHRVQPRHVPARRVIKQIKRKAKSVNKVHKRVQRNVRIHKRGQPQARVQKRQHQKAQRNKPRRQAAKAPDRRHKAKQGGKRRKASAPRRHKSAGKAKRAKKGGAKRAKRGGGKKHARGGRGKKKERR